MYTSTIGLIERLPQDVLIEIFHCIDTILHDPEITFFLRPADARGVRPRGPVGARSREGLARRAVAAAATSEGALWLQASCRAAARGGVPELRRPGLTPD